MIERPRRTGPKARWGKRVPVTIKWPVEHRALYDRLAQEQGISLNEYVVRFVAAGHGLPIPPDARSPDGQQELAISA